MRKKLKGGKSGIKTYFIFGEGETEKCYFSALSEILGNKNEFSYKIESIKYEQIGTIKEKLAFTKKTILNTIYQCYCGLTEKEFIKLGSKIFIILDTDGSKGYTKNQIDIIKNFFKDDKLIKVLFSNRDFELYLLLHLEYYDGINSDYIKLIKKYYSEFDKGFSIKLKKIHKEIIEKGFKSVLPMNIKKIEDNHYKVGNIHIKDKLPFTEIYEIFR